ncbi:hypothetical protein [Ancylobacter mangrovi]|uniref:hypothetical protein n=1 Tax=Ancylobacter mangrovi TaxID=2972472 RepID=UPI00216392D9|nr:hypothetical protein [Ancylobacter mangrovi]MCS0504664.1 hypothetical protein [Ancylobacter mangrovi]
MKMSHPSAACTTVLGVLAGLLLAMAAMAQDAPPAPAGAAPTVPPKAAPAPAAKPLEKTPPEKTAPAANAPAAKPPAAKPPAATLPATKPPATPAPPPGPTGGTQPAPSAADSPEVDPDMQRIAACKAEALKRLKLRSPAVDDIYLDVDGLTVAHADLKIGDTPVKGVIMGEAYIQRDRSDTANRFLCLTGDKDQVIFTFFTER